MRETRKPVGKLSHQTAEQTGGICKQGKTRRRLSVCQDEQAAEEGLMRNS